MWYEGCTVEEVRAYRNMQLENSNYFGFQFENVVNEHGGEEAYYEMFLNDWDDWYDMLDDGLECEHIEIETIESPKMQKINRIDKNNTKMRKRKILAKNLNINIHEDNRLNKNNIWKQRYFPNNKTNPNGHRFNNTGHVIQSSSKNWKPHDKRQIDNMNFKLHDYCHVDNSYIWSYKDNYNY